MNDNDPDWLGLGDLENYHTSLMDLFLRKKLATRRR